MSALYLQEVCCAPHHQKNVRNMLETCCYGSTKPQEANAETAFASCGSAGAPSICPLAEQLQRGCSPQYALTSQELLQSAP